MLRHMWVDASGMECEKFNNYLRGPTQRDDGEGFISEKCLSR